MASIRIQYGADMSDEIWQALHADVEPKYADPSSEHSLITQVPVIVTDPEAVENLDSAAELTLRHDDNGLLHVLVGDIVLGSLPRSHRANRWPRVPLVEQWARRGPHGGGLSLALEVVQRSPRRQ